MSVINFSKFAWLIFTALIMLVTGCGSSGSDGNSGPAVTPPSSSLIGTYNLATFRVEFSNGTVYIPNNFPNVTGTMVIDASTLTQDFVIQGNSVSASGQYSVTFSNAEHSQGNFSITDNSGTHDISFTISGIDLTTYSGVFQVSPSVTAEEWDTWRKTSDVPPAPPFPDRSESEDGYWWIFKSLGP